MSQGVYEKTIKYFEEVYLSFDIPRTFVIYTPVRQRLEALIKKGYRFEDFKSVIDYLNTKWKNTEYHRYVRPETVFGDKFEIYLSDARKGNAIQRLHNAVEQAKQLVDRGVVKLRRRT